VKAMSQEVCNCGGNESGGPSTTKSLLMIVLRFWAHTVTGTAQFWVRALRV